MKPRVARNPGFRHSTTTNAEGVVSGLRHFPVALPHLPFYSSSHHEWEPIQGGVRPRKVEKKSVG